MERQPPRCSADRHGPDVEGVVLEGGTSNQGLVLRIGNTVHRPRSRGSEATHALLRHLEAVGFDGAPRVIGTDDRGREVLSFVPGTAVVPPYPAWALTEAARVGFGAIEFHSDPYAVGFYERMGAEQIGATPSTAIPGRMIPKFRKTAAPAGGSDGGNRSSDDVASRITGSTRLRARTFH